MKLVEYWRWRFRDPKTGDIRRTMYQMTAHEARKLAGAERIPGTLLMREVDDADFVETEPGVTRSPAAR